MWGMTPMTVLQTVIDDDLLSRILKQDQPLPRQPELFIQISVANEFQPMGKINIGVTAGVETTAISKEWIDGCNRMDVIWCISEHSKRAIAGTVVEMKDRSGNILQKHQVNKPVEVLHNCVHTNIFHKISLEDISLPIQNVFHEIKERFCLLFVGHWLQGDFGEDRKNVSGLIKIFCETFKNTHSLNQPALILKTSGAGFSLMDREEILKKIQSIRNGVQGTTIPNVYMLHGDLTDAEMNELYNHPKVKTHISLAHGEGFGRPLLEATMSHKPIISTIWSGQIDFLNPKDAILVTGELKQIHASSVMPSILIPESQWFYVDQNHAASAMMHVFKNYDKFLEGANRLAKTNKEKFNTMIIRERTKQLINAYVPTFVIPQPISLNLPKLKKLPNVQTFNTPTIPEQTPAER
jgi:hypothetical protein